jgi:phosphoribosylanthranilate isomerase
MKTSPKVKICGLKRQKDLLCAKTLGADYFGFILYEKSPRHISLEALKLINDVIPLDTCVFVDVMPTEDKIKSMQDFGCKNFQIHTHEGTNLKEYESYLQLIDREALWLAPQVSDLNQFDEAMLEFADTFLIDSYSKHQIGGTGTVGDWTGFKQLKSKYPNKEWILAGGLTPNNIQDALEASCASFIDVNSGVEEAPGIKSEEALRQLFKAVI